MKLLLDTNILIDLIMNREPYASEIRKLCIAAKFGDVQLWATIQTYTDAYYVLRKYHSRESVKQALLTTLDLFFVCGISPKDLRDALESDWEDIEDYLIAASARTIPADFFITRDAALIEKSPLPTMSAHDFLDYLQTEYGCTYDEIEW